MARSDTKWVEYPEIRMRFELDTEGGVPTRFVYQLECNLQPQPLKDDDWREVARMDHDETGPHDITVEGLHIDLYNLHGTKVKQGQGFPQMPLRQAPAFCEQHLEQNARWYVAQFKQGWPDL